jgi:hypothetical protein
MLLACNSDSDKAIITSPDAPLLKVEFSSHALDGFVVNRLLADEYGVYAATDRGLFYSANSESWQLFTSSDWDVLDIISLNADHLMMTILSRGQYQLVETLDKGITWQFIEHNFGGTFAKENEEINRLQWDPESQVLYAVGIDVLAKSEDQGRNWQVLSGHWKSFGSGMSAVTYSAAYPTIFYGGQGAIENPILRRVNINDLSEDLIDVSHLLPSPSTVEEVRFDVVDPATVYVVGEGGIIKSTDMGDTWEPMLTNHNSRFYFDLIQHPESPTTFYTAGWNKAFNEPQSLVFEVSLDSGLTWEQFQHPDETLFGGVRTMALVKSETETTVYLGLYKGGVMAVDVTVE